MSPSFVSPCLCAECWPRQGIRAKVQALPERLAGQGEGK
ncbi:hypothetical protein T261_4916 [Streptomyces lydicus]|nr:hypothetical protein T261_4916 [Streptomyces lydicus]